MNRHEEPIVGRTIIATQDKYTTDSNGNSGYRYKKGHRFVIVERKLSDNWPRHGIWKVKVRRILDSGEVDLYLKGWWTLTNFDYTDGEYNMNTTLQIESNRPAIVQEITTANGKRENVGSIYRFDRRSDAEAWTKEQIVNTIRADNVYREFAIFVEVAVAQASEPPVVFK